MNAFFSAAQLAMLQAQPVSQWLVQDPEGNLYSQVDAGLYVCIGNSQEVLPGLQMRTARFGGHAMGQQRSQPMSFGYPQGHTPGGFAQRTHQPTGPDTQSRISQMENMARSGQLVLSIPNGGMTNVPLPCSTASMGRMSDWFAPRRADSDLDHVIPWHYGLDAGYEVLVQRMGLGTRGTEPKPRIAGIALPGDNREKWLADLAEAIPAWTERGWVSHPFLAETTDAAPSETIFLEKNFHPDMLESLNLLLAETPGDIPKKLEEVLQSYQSARFN